MKRENGFTLVELMVLFVIFLFILTPLLLAPLAEYTTEYWLSVLADKPVDIPYWICIPLGILAPYPIMGSIITCICDSIDFPPDCKYVPN